MNMGEKLTKKANSNLEESISFQTTQNSTVEDDILTDNQKLWEYIRQKRNCNKIEDLNLMKILQQGLHTDFDIQIEKRKSSSNFQQENKNTGNVEQNDEIVKQIEENERNTSKSKIFTNRYSPARRKSSLLLNSKIKFSPSKRNNHSHLKPNTRSLGKRVLLKEFEKTVVSEKQFNPSCMSTPLSRNVIGNDNSILSEVSSSINKKNIESNLEIEKDKRSLDEGYDNLNKNLTVVNENSMQISSSFNKGKDKEFSDKLKKCTIRIARLQNKEAKEKSMAIENQEPILFKKPLNNRNKSSIEKNQNKTNQNIDFTVIPGTQENLDEIDKNNDKSNNESILILPETQEQEKEKTLTNHKEITISNSLEENINCDANSTNQIKDKNDINLKDSNCILTDKEEQFKFSRTPLDINDEYKNIESEEVMDDIVDAMEELIEVIKSDENSEKIESNITSSKRNIPININEITPSKQRRTYTITRLSNIHLSNVNNENQMNCNAQNGNICQDEEVDIEVEAPVNNNKTNETIRSQDQQWIVTKILNSPRNISKSPAKPTIIKKINRKSRIPQIKRTNNLALKSPTPCKISEVMDRSKLTLPVIVSVQSLADNFNNNKNPTEENNMNETFNRNILSSRLDKIMNVVESSLIPKSPVVIMIDNNGNNKNNDSTKILNNETMTNNSAVPKPPPEFSDSYQTKSKNSSTSFKNKNLLLTRKTLVKGQKNRTNNENVDMQLISDDESDGPEEDGQQNAEKTITVEETDKITDDSLPNENCSFEKQKPIAKKSNVNRNSKQELTFSKRKKNSILKTVNKSNVIDYSMNASNQEKLSQSSNNTSNNNSKMFVPENFTVQPVDLRKRKSRNSSILTQFKINAINELRALRKQTSEEDFDKVLEEYKNKYYNFSEICKDISKLNQKIPNFEKEIDPPLVNVFHEAEYNQSFTEVLKKNDKRNRESRNSFSNLPAPPSFLLNDDENEAEEYHAQNPESSDLRMRNRSISRNSTLPDPPSVSLVNQINSTLPINQSGNINRPKTIRNSYRRLSRYYQFQVENEKHNKKRSLSTPVQLKSNNQKKCYGVELQSQPVEFSNAYNNESNNMQEFPLPPAEAYDRPNQIVIDIPQNQESSSGYVSAHFPTNKRKKSKKGRNGFSADGEVSSSSSTDSPQLKRVFRKQYKIFNKAKSMPSLKEKVSNEFQKVSEFPAQNPSGNNSDSSGTTTLSQVFVDIQQQLNDDTDHVYDEPEYVTQLWKESIKNKSDEHKEKNLKKIKKKVGRSREKNIDSLKESYLNITANLNQSSNKSNDGRRRKLYDKGKSDCEDSSNESKNKNTIDLNSSNISNISTRSSLVSNKSRKQLNMFTNVKKSLNKNLNTDDTLFKKPLLPAPKTNKKNLNKYSLSENSFNSSNREDKNDKENTSSNNKTVIRNSRNGTKNHTNKTEVEILLDSVPRSYKIPLNDSQNVDSALTTRKSSRKPAPRRIYKYYKYYTNEYEVLPSMVEYNQMMKNFNAPLKKQEKLTKKPEKQIKITNLQKNEKIVEKIVPPKKKTSDNDVGNKNKKRGRPKKNNVGNDIIEELDQNDLNNQSKVSTPFVEGIEIQNTNHFAEKQNKNTNKSRLRSKSNSKYNDNKFLKDNSSKSQTKDISKIVDTLKVSFSNFETTILSNLSSNLNNVQNENTVVDSNNKKLGSKKQNKEENKKLTKQNKMSEEVATKQNDIIKEKNKITENVLHQKSNNNESLNNCSTKTTKSLNSESYDFFHWVKQLACASTKINNNKNKSNDHDDDIQRYFAENSFRITDISKMKTSEKDGVEYAFYKEERSKDFGYIKFKPGSKKSTVRSKTFDLHFLFMFGVLEFHIQGQVYHSKAGNFVSIPKGTYYSIINNSSDAACLFFIKVCSNGNNSS